MPTLDYAARPAQKPPRDRPVSAAVCVVFAALVSAVLLFNAPSVAFDQGWILLAAATLGTLAAKLVARLCGRAKWLGWWPMVGLPLLACVAVAAVPPTIYNGIVPQRAFYKVFGTGVPRDARLQFWRSSTFSDGSALCFYFHADATEVAHLVAAAGLAVDEKPRADVAAGLPAGGVAEGVLKRLGYSSFLNPLPAAPGLRFFAGGSPKRGMSLIYDPATGEVWAVREYR